MMTEATELNWFNIGATIIYMMILVVMGLAMNKKIKSRDDYWVGGRQIGPVVTALSYCAAFYSTVMVIGGPSMIYRYGISYMMPNILGATFTTGILIFIVLALKMRVVSSRTDSVSLPGFLSARYGSKAIGLICAILIAVLMIPYGVSVLKGIADAFTVLGGVPYKTGVIIISIVSVLYMVSSGYWGIALTDVVQGILISVGMVLLSIYVVASAGGITNMMITVTELYPIKASSPPGTFNNIFQCLSICWVWQLIAFGQPQLVTKFLGLKDPRTIKTVVHVSVPWIAVFLTCSGLIGIGGLYFYGGNVENPDRISSALAFASGSSMLQAMFLIAAVAAGLSTLVSLVLSSSAAVTRDIYEDYICFRKGVPVDSKKSIKLSRIVTIIVLFLMMYLALNPWDFVWEMSTLAAGTMGAGFVAPMMVGLYWKEATCDGAIWAVITGVVVNVIWYVAGLSYIVHPFLPGMLVSFITIFVVSKMTKGVSGEIVSIFFDKNYSKKIDAPMYNE